MRSYAPYDKTKKGHFNGKKKERKERTSDEWDVRIDCDKTYAEEICTNLRNAEGMLVYALVSGIEKSDTEQHVPSHLPEPRGGSSTYGSANNHVHIALIFKYHLRRDQVLAVCRGLFKKTDEYCTPRNKKFTYAGWYMHHAKLDWKLVNEPPVRMEIGVLPEDDSTEYNLASIKRLYKKFGCDDLSQSALLKSRFSKYLD